MSRSEKGQNKKGQNKKGQGGKFITLTLFNRERWAVLR